MEPQYEDEGESNGSSHGGRRNLKLWQNTAVETLIELIKANHERLCNREENKSGIWKEIAQNIQGVAPGMTAKQVEIKWKNIRLRYFKFKTYKDKEGSKFKCPAYYKILDSFLPETPPTPRGHSYKYFFESSTLTPEDTFEDFDSFVPAIVKEPEFLVQNTMPVAQDLNVMTTEPPHSIFNPNYKTTLLTDLCQDMTDKTETHKVNDCNDTDPVLPVVSNASDIVECQMEGDDATLSHGGKRDIFMWNNRGTGALIHLVKDNYKKLNMKEVKSHKVWRDISQKLQAYVPGVTAKQARIKWRNVRSYYLKFKFRRTARTKMPPYYRLLSSFLFVRPVASKSVYHPGMFLENGGLEGEPDPSTYANYQERLRLEEHLKKSEKTSRDLLEETKKSNVFLEKLVEKFEIESKKTGDFQDTMLQMQESMLRTQESLLQSIRENIDMQRNYSRIQTYGKQDWQKPMF